MYVHTNVPNKVDLLCFDQRLLSEDKITLQCVLKLAIIISGPTLTVHIKLETTTTL
jgi:hypothetical protein